MRNETLQAETTDSHRGQDIRQGQPRGQPGSGHRGHGKLCPKGVLSWAERDGDKGTHPGGGSRSRGVDLLWPHHRPPHFPLLSSVNESARHQRSVTLTQTCLVGFLQFIWLSIWIPSPRREAFAGLLSHTGPPRWTSPLGLWEGPGCPRVFTTLAGGAFGPVGISYLALLMANGVEHLSLGLFATHTSSLVRRPGVSGQLPRVWTGL